MACTGRNLEFGRATVALAVEGKKEPRDVCEPSAICPHRRGFRRRRFLCRRTSSPRPPQPTRHQRNLPADHPGSCGGAWSRGLLTRSPFPEEVRNCDFADGGRRALPQHLAAQVNASARPPWLSVRVTIGINRQASPSGAKTTEMAVSDFVGRGGGAGRP